MASQHLLEDAAVIGSKPLCLSEIPDPVNPNRNSALLATFAETMVTPDTEDNVLSVVQLINKRYSSISTETNLKGMPLGTQALIYDTTRDTKIMVDAFMVCFQYLFPIAAGDVLSEKLKRHKLLFCVSHSRENDGPACSIVESILGETLRQSTSQLPPSQPPAVAVSATAPPSGSPSAEAIAFAANVWVRYFAPILVMRCIVYVHSSQYVSISYTLHQTAVLSAEEAEARSAVLTRLRFGRLLLVACSARTVPQNK
ncbi:hypothetical protein MRX96_040033 [Rhipicephalus microplus]